MPCPLDTSPAASDAQAVPFATVHVTLTKQQQIELVMQASGWKSQHRRAVQHALWRDGRFGGYCDGDALAGSFNDRSLPLMRRWRAILQRKGVRWRPWLHFTRRHGGALWPLYFA